MVQGARGQAATGTASGFWENPSQNELEPLSQDSPEPSAIPEPSWVTQ